MLLTFSRGFQNLQQLRSDFNGVDLVLDRLLWESFLDVVLSASEVRCVNLVHDGE